MAERAGSVKVGNVLRYKDGYYEITDTQHVKPGKGGAFMQLGMKHLKHGTKLNEKLRTEDEVEIVRCEAIPVSYLYKDGNNLYFMNQETFEQYGADDSIVNEDEAKILTEGMIVTLEKIDEEIIKLRLPVNFVATIIETQPALRNQTADAKTKPAKLDNGLEVQVPVFLIEGEKILVRSADLTYLEKAKKE